jgi:SAM-dependent methyltransferase
MPVAQAEVDKWNVARRTGFVVYDGNLDIFADEAFDLVFTKSTLTMIPQLADLLHKIAAKLKPGGKIVFLENGRGNWLLHSLRALRHRHWDYRSVTYFTRREIQLIGGIFELDTVRYHRLPPVYLVLGHKRRERVT